MSEFRQYLSAVRVAVWHGLKLRNKPWQRIRSFLFMLKFKCFGREADPILVKARNAECEKCPIFYKPLGTCGSPLDPQLDGLGCWCHVRTKNRIPQATCWWHDQTNGEAGWPKELYDRR